MVLGCAYLPASMSSACCCQLALTSQSFHTKKTQGKHANAHSTRVPLTTTTHNRTLNSEREIVHGVYSVLIFKSIHHIGAVGVANNEHFIAGGRIVGGDLNLVYEV